MRIYNPTKVRAIIEGKDSRIAGLLSEVLALEENIRRLESRIREKDLEIAAWKQLREEAIK